MGIIDSRKADNVASWAGVEIAKSDLLSDSKEVKMRRRLLFIILIALVVTCGTSVYAEDVAQQKTTVTVTPRVWFAFGDVADGDWYNAESFSIPMYGATVSMAPSFMPNWSFLLTGLVGESDGDFTATGGASGSADYERDDIEFLIRYTIPRTGLSFFFGPRYVNWQTEHETPAWGNYKTEDKSEIWAAEVGVGYVSAIGESGKHRFFSNITLGIAFIDWEWKSNDPSERDESGSDSQPMVDLNIGYEYLFTNSASLSLRYRLFTLREENDFGYDRWTTFHGPEIGISFRF